MAGLLDVMQGASNAAAGAVSGPVDLINTGLLAMGLPMPAKPVGGSRWMRDRGLTRDPKNFYAGLAGETIGNVLPIVAAAKAPQIAQGLLQAGENLRAPTPMNSATRGQAGAIVYHGSPHKFDRFDSSKIGTGEGAQAYGHGLYFAESPDVARSYANALTDAGTGARVGTDTTSLVPRNRSASVQDVLDAKHAELQRLRAMAADGHKYAAGWIKGAEEQIAELRKKATVYRVDLPDDAIARMLDWDKPWSQQQDAVRKAINTSALERFYNTKDLPTSQVLYHVNQGRSPAQSAEFFRQQGVPGVRYLDGGSRTAGAGTSNYVVFPGEEGLLKIIGRE
jgi:hypothetical protein